MVITCSCIEILGLFLKEWNLARLCSSHKSSPDCFSYVFLPLLYLFAEYVSLCSKTESGTSNVLQMYFKFILFLRTTFLPCIPWHLCLFCSQEGQLILFGSVHNALMLSFFPKGGFLASFSPVLYGLNHFVKLLMSCGDEEEEDKDSK